MDGLIIKKEWLDLIVKGEKTIEIRGCTTSKVDETIYLLESCSHKVRATCKISSTYPISCSDWCEEMEEHCVNISYKELKQRYKTPTAWVLSEVEEIEDNWIYSHPKGAVIWVKDVEIINKDDNEYLRSGY